MIVFRASARVNEDRRVVLELPPQTPVGDAELVVTVEPRQPGGKAGGGLRRLFGTVHGGDAHGADNERIDHDLTRSYADPHDELT
jgi:hypothetical protein